MSSLFETLDAHPGAYWIIAGAATLVWLGALFGDFHRGSARSSWTRGFLFPLSVLALLLAWRWPYLLAAYEYNPDESQLLASAISLRTDPVFWRSTDGSTSGPLNAAALLPLSWLGLPLDYFTARRTGLLLCWGGLVSLLSLLRRSTTPGIAALAIVPGVSFFAAASQAELVHYSSELVSLFLLAHALGWSARRPFLAAFLAGCMPWAKMQAGPLAALFIGWLLWNIARDSSRALRSRLLRAGRLFLAAGAFTFFVAAYTAAFGQFYSMLQRYFLQNVIYTGEGRSLGVVLGNFVDLALDTRHVASWIVANVLLLLLAATRYFHQRRRPGPLFWLGAALSALAVFSILAPTRNFLHYVLLLPIPLTLWTGVALVETLRPSSSRALLVSILIVASAPLLVRTGEPVPEMFGNFAQHWRHPRTPLGEVLHHWYAPERRLVVWGWLPSAHVESGIPQGARDGISERSILEWAHRDSYRAAYLADIQRTRPELFVDAVGPGAARFSNRERDGFESFPALADYIRQHYRLVAEIPPSRVYARTDFLEDNPIGPDEWRRLIARGRPAPVTIKDVAEDALPRLDLNGRSVQLLEPPARLRWPLTGTEREVTIRFGFHPKAYTEGTTDGAAVIVEMEMPRQPPLVVFQRLLEPLAVPADREPQEALIELPPFPDGSALSVRTTPGRGSDGGWDWIYLQELSFGRFPTYLPAQFPAFSRPPDHFISVYPHLIGEGSERHLMIPPPAQLTFVLRGAERVLTFDYGIKEGAYTGDGGTDGVIYTLEFERDGEPARVLLSRPLHPLSRSEDRGAQRASVPLPDDARAGDRLVLRLASGPSDAWDWAYISRLELR